ncbi:MAG: tRNA (N6-threonylcarbamoyladenosine(37)-N6)-methyltransferase TrmO [Bermanella sp.]
MKFEITPIAYIQSCYKEKFATPRQPGLVTAAKGEIPLIPPFNHPDTVAGLENCSHLWLQFVFHQCLDQGWKNKVRPPRLGGNKKMGVFATRTTHRPNALGLSVVALDNIRIEKQSVILEVSALDLIDGTPIVDIKPYIPYSDALAHARYDFAQLAPEELTVLFSTQAQLTLNQQDNCQQLSTLIRQVLAQDPRPAFHALDESRIYGAKLDRFNVNWRYLATKQQTNIEVVAITLL